MQLKWFWLCTAYEPSRPGEKFWAPACGRSIPRDRVRCHLKWTRPFPTREAPSAGIALQVPARFAMSLFDHDGSSASKTRPRLPFAGRAGAAVAILFLAVAGWQLRRASAPDHPEGLIKAVGDHTLSAVALFLLIYGLAAAAVALTPDEID